MHQHQNQSYPQHSANKDMPAENSQNDTVAKKPRRKRIKILVYKSVSKPTVNESTPESGGNKNDIGKTS